MAERPDRQAKKRFQFPQNLLNTRRVFHITLRYLLFTTLLLFQSFIFSKDSFSQVTGTTSRNSSLEKIDTKIIWDFTSISISHSLWLENGIFPWISLDILKNNIREGNLSEKLPKRGVINKWNEEVTIGIGWPPRVERGNSQNENINKSRESVIFEKSIIALIPELEKITALKFKYISRQDERLGKAAIAKIRVIPEHNTGLRNRFKMANTMPPGVRLHNTKFTHLSNQINGVPFTPSSRSQVEGFFVPDENNNIKSAICRISVENSEKMASALLKECLVRSLGLPNLSQISSQSLLASWNSIADPMSLIPSREGKAAYYWPIAFGKPIEAPLEPPSIPEFGMYERQLLKLLYCNELKPGQDEVSAIIVLLSSNKCFDH